MTIQKEAKELKCVKLVEKKEFTVGLYQLSSGKYRVIYTRGNTRRISDMIIDFRIASDIFDLKVQELEGH